ncbi:methylase involved in ubiquinone/menaquinone biosynthesis [Caldisphaera lagunensis DSM 15908]|uniref:Methylase involved in ubiquinone/menaquinone biosynthesis n=1 Tax=Caldisphaera lagunensis (strain DSM 15908 / JCM 11604 / ANMR 0165 / IC-154) TaxID=1056495 RepID=L0ABF4_CALLD|nr:class I SAM-dependent methyltransferase [Caldisphaera lagunensis]AFZ71228.1 methylase involved in ubiquinone/menaquinone biosynthesis [Caldisphaera lagunensis DSM 15908]
MVSDPFDTYSLKYDEWYEKHKILYENELNAVFRVKTKGISLEIGVGSGRFAKPLNIDFGLDPSIELLKIARKRGIEVIKGVGEHLPFSNKKFDVIYLIVTICFVDDPIRTLKESNRVLKNNGSIIIGFVPKESKWGKYYESIKDTSPFYKYATFYSYKEIVNMINETDFKVVETISTLFQNVNQKEIYEEPINGYNSDAGFIIIKAMKL